MLMMRPAAPLHHALDHRAGGVERALQVGVEHRVPVVVVEPEQDVVAGEAGVVDQDVDRAERLLGRGDRAPRPDRPSATSQATPAARVAELGGDRLGALAASRPTTATLAPAPWSARAMARPMPRVLPVTKAVLPVRSIVVDHVTRRTMRGISPPRRPCRSVTVASRPGTIRLSRPASTFPGPISTNARSGRQRRGGLHARHPAHRRGELVGQEPLGVGAGRAPPRRWRWRSTGNAGSANVAPRRAPSRSPSTAGAISGEWNAPLTLSGMHPLGARGLAALARALRRRPDRRRSRSGRAR